MKPQRVITWTYFASCFLMLFLDIHMAHLLLLSFLNLYIIMSEWSFLLISSEVTMCTSLSSDCTLFFYVILEVSNLTLVMCFCWLVVGLSSLSRSSKRTWISENFVHHCTFSSQCMAHTRHFSNFSHDQIFV